MQISILMYANLLIQVRLYEEADKPSNALDYLKNNFNGKETEVAQLKAENLEKENVELKEKVGFGIFKQTTLSKW